MKIFVNFTPRKNEKIYCYLTASEVGRDTAKISERGGSTAVMPKECGHKASSILLLKWVSTVSVTAWPAYVALNWLWVGHI